MSQTNIVKILHHALKQRNILQHYQRSLTAKKYSTFNIDDDGDTVPEGMKTKVTVLSQEEDANFSITAYSTMGFLLNTGIRVIGPCAVFPRSVLHWNVRSAADINENSLALFPLLEPKLDILILGVGEASNMSVIDPNIVRYLRQNRINVEILTTEQALPTFNFLNSEKRYVAGAFMPPGYLESDLMERNIFQTNLDDNEDQEGLYSGVLGKDFGWQNLAGREAARLTEEFKHEDIPKVTAEQRKLFRDKYLSNFQSKKPPKGDQEPRGDQH